MIRVEIPSPTKGQYARIIQAAHAEWDMTTCDAHAWDIVLTKHVLEYARKAAKVTEDQPAGSTA